MMRNKSVTYSEATIFRALADPTRRALLHLLRSGSRQAGDIAGAFHTSRPAISRHLRRLRRAQLVREHREGRYRVYELNPGPLRAVDSWLDQYRTFWRINLNSLKTYVEAENPKETPRNNQSKSQQRKKKRA